MLLLILPDYTRRYPLMDVEVVEANTKRLEEDLMKGKVDIVLTPFHIESDTVAMEKIYEEEIVLVAQKGTVGEAHLVPGKMWTVDLAKLGDLPCILLRPGHGISTAMQLLFDAYQVTPNKVMEVSSNMTAFRLAAAGSGVAFVPTMTVNLAQGFGDLEFYSMTPHSTTWEITASYRKEAYMREAERGFIEIAREACGKARNTPEQIRQHDMSAE